jgi:Protein of unknown function (DUF3089)
MPRTSIAAVAVVAAVATASAAGGTAKTVWLCKPGQAHDPCTSSLAATVVTAAGAHSVVTQKPAANPPLDCFYVYPTVSTETTPNSDLEVQKAETATATAQASRFSTVCRVYAPMYRQVTLTELFTHPTLQIPLSVAATAYESLVAGFRDYLAHDNHGRPIVFIGHSQGAAILIALLQQMVDDDAALRGRTVMAIILGGDVEVRPGKLVGGSFSHIPLCARAGEAGCVIAYSSFPGEPPKTALFGRPGQGVALQSQQPGAKGVQVACVNPAAIGGGAATLDPYLPSEGKLPTPWVEFPGLYTARCMTAPGGVGWLQVRKATGASDKRPVVTEDAGPDWGYHVADVNLALGDLVRDVSAAGRTWLAARKHRSGP